MKKIKHDFGTYEKIYTEVASSTHTIAYLKYKDGKLQLMHNLKSGKKHFSSLDDFFTEMINKPIQIDVKEYEVKIKMKKNKADKITSPSATLKKGN